MRPILSLMLLMGVSCSGDKNEVIQSSAPSVQLVSHSNGDAVTMGYPVTFLASVEDTDSALEDLSVVWSAGGMSRCTESQWDDGLAYCEMTLAEGEAEISVTVTDPDGNAAMTDVFISLEMTAAPVVTLSSPVNDGTYFANVLVDLLATIEDERDGIDEMNVVWTSSIDGELPVTPTVESTQVQGQVALSEGTHTITLTAIDRSGAVGTDRVEITVGPDNQPPDCLVVSPLTYDIVGVDRTVEFQATVSDDEQPTDLLAVIWRSDKDGQIGTSTPTPSGDVTLAFSQLSLNNHVITMSVSDGFGGLCEDDVVLLVENPPEISIQSPLDGAVETFQEIVVVSMIAADVETASTALSVVLTSDLDGEVFTGTPDAQGLLEASLLSLSPGEHQIQATVVDESGLETTVQQLLRINRLPEIQQLTLSPSPVYTTDDLLASVTANDLDGDVVSFVYQWYEDGQLTTHTGDTITAIDLQAGDEWRVVVTPNDGFANGGVQEQGIVVSNTPPSLSNLQITPSTGVLNDQVVNCSVTVTDPDQSIIPVYQWQIDGVTNNGSSLDLSTMTALPGQTLTCEVTATDAAAVTVSDTTSVVIDNRSPSVSNVLIDIPTPTSADVVVCSIQWSDPDGETLTENVDWTLNGTALSSGATLNLSSYTVMPGDTLACVGTVTDVVGATAQGTDTVMIVNTPPSIDGISISPNNANDDDVVTCSAVVSDLDGEALTTTMELRQGNQVLGTQTGNSVTVDLSNFALGAGDVLTCVVDVTDASGDTTQQTETMTLGSSAPTVSNHVISPSTGVYTGTTLQCSATASDPNDGDVSGSMVYTWSINGTVVHTGASYTPSSSESNVGDTIICSAMATDSDGQMDSSLMSVTLQNTAPIIQNGSISPSVPYNDQVVSCQATVTDPDESVPSSYAWYEGSTLLGNGSTLDLDTTSMQPGDTLTCEATGTDTQGVSDSLSVNVVVGNRAPNTPTVSISWSGNSGTPIAGATLSCQATATDPDGGSPSLSYQWLSSGGMSITGTTVSGSSVQGGDTWTCTATASDGIASSSGSTTVSVLTPCAPDTDYETLDLGGLNDAELVRVCAGNDGQGRYTIAHDFVMLTTEVTQGMFQDLMGYDPTLYGNTFAGNGIFGSGADYPVYYVNWHMAADFANSMTNRHNALTGASLTQCYSCSNSGNDAVTCSMNSSCSGYRMPTEAEWEYAAKVGTSSDFWTPSGGGTTSSSACYSPIPIQDGGGTPALDTYAWYCYNRYDGQYYNTDKPVGLKQPNGFGLYDLHGNISEWTTDRWGCPFPASNVDPVCTAVGSEYSIRGGDWTGNATTIQASSRSALDGSYRAYKQGFRVVRGL